MNTRTKIKAVDSLESTAFIILSTHFHSFFADQLSGNPLLLFCSPTINAM